MDLGTLKPSEGSVGNSKRIGRGNATGQGRTAGKGHNGYQSRSGTKNRFHFEGGQTPLMRRLPKRGFSNYGFRKEVQIVNLGRIVDLGIDNVDVNILSARGVIPKTDIPVKILGNGDIKNKINLSVDYISKSAKKKLEKVGGTIILNQKN